MLDTIVQTLAAAMVSAGGTGVILYFVLKHTMKPIDAYLETKGKNLATHQDIMKLVDQVRATKSVEAGIGDNVWDRQQRWTAKHAMYRELMGSLHALFSVAVTLDAYTQHAPKDSGVIHDSRDSLVSSWIRFSTLARVAGITMSGCGAWIIHAVVRGARNPNRTVALVPKFFCFFRESEGVNDAIVRVVSVEIQRLEGVHVADCTPYFLQTSVD